MELFPEAELRNEVAVLVLILAFQVFKKPSSLTHKFEQTAAGSVVLGVGFEMVGQHFDAVGKEGDLNLRRSGVLLILAVLANDCLNLVLLFLYLSHFLSYSLVLGQTFEGWPSAQTQNSGMCLPPGQPDSVVLLIRQSHGRLKGPQTAIRPESRA